MRVSRARGLAGARGATGTVVVIDVLRAFTTAAYALDSGAEAIELVATPAEAFARRAAEPGLVLVGEVGGRPIAGFDHGNSPERMAALDLTGRALVLRSSSGVQGALAALPTAAALLLGSLVTAEATVRAARALGHDVTLLAMGAGGSEIGLDGPEDDACAALLAARLEGRPVGWAEIEGLVRSGPAARAALDPTETWISPGDLERALALDRFDFALAARLESGRLVARRMG
jgi:2-phosphosulfolactate phosphatase